MRDMSWRLAAMVPALLFGIAMLASLAAGFWFVAAIWLPVAFVALWLRHFLLSSGKRRLWLGVLLVGASRVWFLSSRVVFSSFLRWLRCFLSMRAGATSVVSCLAVTRSSDTRPLAWATVLPPDR